MADQYEMPPNWGGQAVQAFQEQRVLTQAPAVQAVQEIYWRDRANNKRGPPTPVASSAATPQEDAARMGPDLAAPTLVQPWTLEDHTASQLVAAEFGADINSEQGVQQWLSQPVQTNKDVMAIVRSYHAKVIRPELYHLVLQVETALGKLGDDLFATRQELAWMASENRLQQKQHCALQIITSGWPQGMGPKGREFMLSWMLQQVPKVKHFLEERGNIDNLTSDHTARWFNVFSADPVTIPQGQDWWSGMTLLTFKSFDLRSAFLERYGGQGGTPIYANETTPVQGKHVRVSPCSPQWQRKLESPLRVMIAVLNQHAEYAGQTLVILWKTLTLMQPSTERGFNGDVVAWGRLFYAEHNGEFRGRLEITPQMKAAMSAKPANVGAAEPDLWSECWNQIIWGSQYDLDQAEAAAYKEARDHTAVSGKGVKRGKGRKHWSSALIHTDYYCPYPLTLEVVVVDQIAFCWDEYCQKTGKPEECVGDLGVATYQGKPPLPTTTHERNLEADTSGDVTMAPAAPSTTPPAALAKSTAPPTVPEIKQKGKPKGRGRS